MQSGPSGAKHARGAATSLASLLAPEAVDAHAIGFSTDDALRAIRTHLGMDVAFVSEFTGGRRVFRRVDAAPGDCPVREGDAGPLEDSYCQRVVDGRLPELIHDAAEIPAAAELPVTAALPVGAHLSVPIRLADGRVYGTFCCFSAKPDHTLTDRDLAVMRIFADLTGAHIDRTLQEDRRTDEAGARVRGVLRGDGMSMVFQPIVDIDRGRVVGVEALARFDVEPSRGPDAWFAEAAAVGLGVDLELTAVELGLRALRKLPDDVYVGVNVSPATVLSGRLSAVLAGIPPGRAVLELTEHDAIEAYDELVIELGRLKSSGVRTAVDDAGAGYATFRHILRLRPDVIKLDMALTRDVDTDATRRALASALIAFGRETGSVIVAEGVETAAELRTLRALGVTTAQGYHLGRPSTLPVLEDVPAATRS